MDRIFDRAGYEDFIAREMYERRKFIINEASQYVPRQFSEAFIDLITAAHDWDIPQADKFINLLHLEEKDWAALKDDRSKYIHMLLQEDMDERDLYFG